MLTGREFSVLSRATRALAGRVAPGGSKKIDGRSASRINVSTSSSRQSTGGVFGSVAGEARGCRSYARRFQVPAKGQSGSGRFARFLLLGVRCQGQGWRDSGP